MVIFIKKKTKFDTQTDTSIAQFISKLCLENSPQAAAHVRFEWADINKSGAVEYDEWRRAFCQLESDAIKVSRNPLQLQIQGKDASRTLVCK